MEDVNAITPVALQDTATNPGRKRSYRLVRGHERAAKGVGGVAVSLAHIWVAARAAQRLAATLSPQSPEPSQRHATSRPSEAT